MGYNVAMNARQRYIEMLKEQLRIWRQVEHNGMAKAQIEYLETRIYMMEQRNADEKTLQKAC